MAPVVPRSLWIRMVLRHDLIALLTGALLPLAFAPFALYPLALLLPAMLFWLWLQALTPKRAMRQGLLFGVGFFGVGISWVYVAIDVSGQSGVVMATLLTLLFVLVLALFPALIGYLAVWLRRRLQLAEPTFLLLLLPALWFLVEVLRGWVFSGFPWLTLGYSQIDSPLVGWAAVIGVGGISLLLALMAGSLVLAWRQHSLLPLLLVAIVTLSGWGLATLTWVEPAGQVIRVAIIQGNQPQLTKWDPSKVRQRLEVYAQLTQQVLPESDLVVWPENAITVFYGDYKQDYFDPLAQMARDFSSDIVVGVPLQAETGTGYYTTLTALGRSGEQHYLKTHLVPFGEFLPFDTLLRGVIDFFNLPMSSFSAGPIDQLPLRVAGEIAAVTICYEDAFPSVARRNLPESTFLINGSNNAWYGDSLAPHQHLEIARMRAVESGRPVVRATTNGISALIGERGGLLATSRQFETVVLQGEIQAMTGATPYIQGGYLVGGFWSLLALVATTVIGRRTQRA